MFLFFSCKDDVKKYSCIQTNMHYGTIIIASSIYSSLWNTKSTKSTQREMQRLHMINVWSSHYMASAAAHSCTGIKPGYATTMCDWVNLIWMKLQWNMWLGHVSQPWFTPVKSTEGEVGLNRGEVGKISVRLTLNYTFIFSDWIRILFPNFWFFLLPFRGASEFRRLHKCLSCMSRPCYSVYKYGIWYWKGLGVNLWTARS